MDIFAAGMLFALLILIYMGIAEVFTVLFRFTGLPAEKARFQVVSLLTGSGFTTRESEMVVSTRQRRKLARATMLFGYVFNITIVSAFVNVFLSLKQAEIASIFWGLPAPIAFFVVIMLLRRNKKIHTWENRMIERLAGHLSGQTAENSLLLLDYIGQNAMVTVTINVLPDEFKDVPLAQTGLKADHGILVMLLERGGGEPESVTADTVFLPGDRITVLGPLDTVRSVFHAEEKVSDESE